MTWFSLPITEQNTKAAFADSAAATAWLAQQPLANAAAMQTELIRQIQALNAFRMAPRERFKTLEVLRKTIFMIDGESQRRFENRPIPLWSSEQSALDTARRLWRCCSVAYLHCLRACLDGDTEIVEFKAKIAHRTLVCLRMEQLTSYLGGQDLEPDFWRTLHSILAAAEQLGITRTPIADRLLVETSESTITGQYAMTLLLHLARPFELSRNQFAAATRWFARWREQADITTNTSIPAKSNDIPLDLSLDEPIAEPGCTPGIPRLLKTENVLRKIRKRIEALEAGESPESLKLGNGMSSETCISLLKKLTENLHSPLQALASVSAGATQAKVATGLDNIHRQLGGKSLKQTEELSSINRREQEQIAIFGQMSHLSEEKNTAKSDDWLLMPDSEPDGKLHLCRPAGTGEARLSNKCLLALNIAGHTGFSLATVVSLCMHSDGSLHAIARPLSGKPVPRVADISERPMGKVTRQPAFLLPAVEPTGTPQSIILPSGAQARALSINLDQERATPLKLLSCIERGSDYERWSYGSI